MKYSCFISFYYKIQEMNISSISIIISLIALSLGIVNFYYNFLRKKKSLHLVTVKRDTNMIPEFVMINAGTTDLIITDIHYSFKYENSFSVPAQRIEWNESESLLISPGKGIHGKIFFTEKLTSRFAMQGVLCSDMNDRYEHPLHVNVSWVQHNGIQHKKSVLIAIILIASSGQIAGYKPVSRKKTDLYMFNMTNQTN